MSMSDIDSEKNGQQKKVNELKKGYIYFKCDEKNKKIELKNGKPYKDDNKLKKYVFMLYNSRSVLERMKRKIEKYKVEDDIYEITDETLLMIVKINIYARLYGGCDKEIEYEYLDDLGEMENDINYDNIIKSTSSPSNIYDEKPSETNVYELTISNIEKHIELLNRPSPTNDFKFRITAEEAAKMLESANRKRKKNVRHDVSGALHQKHHGLDQDNDNVRCRYPNVQEPKYKYRTNILKEEKLTPKQIKAINYFRDKYGPIIAKPTEITNI